MPKQINGVPKREISDAEFRMVEENGQKRRSFGPVFTVGLIIAIFFLFMWGLKIGHEADQVPQTEEEFLNRMQHEEVQIEDLPSENLSQLIKGDESKSPPVNRKEIARAALIYLDHVWTQAEIN